MASSGEQSGSSGGSTATVEEGKAASVRLIAGLLAVSFGLLALLIIALVGMGFVKSDNPSVVSIATASFGVIGTVIGAYFGSKASNDSTQKAIDNTQHAIDAMRDESAKAQVFAAHLDPRLAPEAITQWQRLRSVGEQPPSGPAPSGE